MKAWKWIFVAGIGIVAVAAGIARAVTTDVFNVKANVQGAIEYFSVTNEVTKVKTNGVTINVTNQVVKFEILTVTLASEDIINLAMGRDLGTKPPKNEVLAVTTRCGQGLHQWVVYDKDAKDIVAVVGQFVPQLQAVGEKKDKEKMEEISLLTILPTGSPTNAFISGSLSANIQSDLNTNGCVKTSSITMIGYLNTIIAFNNYQTSSNPISIQPVLIRKSTLKTTDTKPIGSFVVGEP